MFLTYTTLTPFFIHPFLKGQPFGHPLCSKYMTVRDKTKHKTILELSWRAVPSEVDRHWSVAEPPPDLVRLFAARGIARLPGHPSARAAIETYREKV